MRQRRKTALTIIRDENGIGFLLPSAAGGLEVVYLTGEVFKRPYLPDEEAADKLNSRFVGEINPSVAQRLSEKLGLGHALREKRPDRALGVSHRFLSFRRRSR